MRLTGAAFFLNLRLEYAIAELKVMAPVPLSRLIPTLRAFACLAVIGWGFWAQCVQAAEASQPILHDPESLTVGATTYHEVQVRSVNARTLVIAHRDGLASIRLRDLPAAWQARFSYDPALAAAAEVASRSTPSPISSSSLQRRLTASYHSQLDDLVKKFGQPAVLKTPIDLRPKLFKFELAVKNQGRRPSCAIFAIVSALEFQRAELTGQVEKFSEEYLIWATRKTVQPLPKVRSTTASDSIRDEPDEGFSLFEVVEALRAYGIPLQATMPNAWSAPKSSWPEPAPDLIQAARQYQRVFVHQLPGRDVPTRLNNIIHALQAGLPVPIGIAWPAGRIIRGYIGAIPANPDAGHAVTLVGCQSATGQIEDAVFIFKNSWGPHWGQGGYGQVTYDYLRQNLRDAVWLEVLLR